jgi:hypothetical protein
LTGMLKKAPRLLAFLVLAVTVTAAATAWAADAPALPRVEVRSADLWAVGVVHDDKMSIHLSRLIDNAPVRDAAISVVLRGTAHSATAESDGSYSLQTKDLTLPGPAAVEFQVGTGAARESLKGRLDIGPAAGQPDDRNNARQLWWWVLNFAVCFGVLWLISRRRKAAQT